MSIPRPLLLSLVLFVIWLLAGCSDTTYPPVEILHSEFLLYDESPNAKARFVPTRIVPLRQGQAYIWVIYLRTNKERVAYKEQLTLASSAQWNLPDDVPFEVSPDKTTVTVSREVYPRDGQILHAWRVAAGDPPGKAFIKVTIEGKVEHRFDFELKSQ